MKKVIYSRQANKSLERIPLNEAQRIRRKVLQYAADPASQANNIVRLQGRDGYKLRVGDWRVIFDEDDRVIAVENVGSRGSIY